MIFRPLHQWGGVSLQDIAKLRLGVGVPQVFICSYMCLQFSRVAKTVTTRYY